MVMGRVVAEVAAERPAEGRARLAEPPDWRERDMMIRKIRKRGMMEIF